MDLRRISDPIPRAKKLEVLSVAKVKAQERVLHSREDELIGDYIEAAFDHLHGLGGWLNGYCLLEEAFEFFPGIINATSDLPLRPIVDDAGVMLARRLALSDYTDFGVGAFMVAVHDGFGTLARLTTTGFDAQAGIVDPREYRITLNAGHKAPADVPRPLVQAMLLLAGHWYQNREATMSDPRVTNVSRRVEFGLQALAGRYRISPDHS